MGLFLVALSLVFLVGPCAPQGPEQLFDLTLKALLEGQTKILQMLDDQERKIKTQHTMMQELQTKLALIEVQTKEVQNCAKLEQVEIFQNMFETNQENLSSSLEKCSTKDQMITVLDLFEADECEDKTHNCSTVATCIDTITSYKCSCMPGFLGDGFTCEDINECDSGEHKCHPQATCTNTMGNYSCNCLPSYEGDGYSCTDINECVSGEHKCDAFATCTNTIGNYTCKCDYSHYGDGYNCTDINECDSGDHDCHSHATCTNTVGSYSCKCSPSYCGDGRYCARCIKKTVEIKGLGFVSLLKQNGTWNNAQDSCKAHHTRLLEGIRSEHLQILKQHFEGDLAGWNPYVGFQGGHWLKSGDIVEEDLWRTGEPDGSKEDLNDCGTISMFSSPASLYDSSCSQPRYPLCVA